MTNQPKRIQRKRTKGWTKPENTVNVTRPGKWGNQFPWKSHADEVMVRWEAGELKLPNGNKPPTKEHCDRLGKRAAVLEFEANLTEEFKAEIRRELKGKNLMCWCGTDSPCHGDVLLRIANEKTADE